jgi:hypothetical protein
MVAPLEMHGEKRADLHRAARLSLLHDRVVKRLDKVDDSADAVEMAAAAFVEATHGRSSSIQTSQVVADDGWLDTRDVRS